MDRRYYKLKAFIVALGIGMALISGMNHHPRLSMARVHYGAATTVQVALEKTTANISAAIAHFVGRQDCARLLVS